METMIRFIEGRPKPFVVDYKDPLNVAGHWVMLKDFETYSEAKYFQEDIAC